MNLKETPILLEKRDVLLNGNRLRGNKRFLFANTMAENMPTMYDVIDKKRFHPQADRSKEEAVQNKKTKTVRDANRQGVFISDDEILHDHNFTRRVTS